MLAIKETKCQCRRYETWVQSLGWEHPLEEGMATHSIPWTEEPGRLYSIGSQSEKWKWKSFSQVRLCDPGILQARILEWVAFYFSRDLPNPGLLHCWRILYQLSFKGSPRILEWVAYHFSRGSSWLRHWTGVSCIAGRFFTNWAMRVAKSQIQLKWLSTHAWAI